MYLSNDVPNISMVVPLPDNPETCVNIKAMQKLLSNHPNRKQVDYVITGLKEGFDIGYVGGELRDAYRNNKSARDNASKVNAAIMECLREKTLTGPFEQKPMPHVHCSPIGAAEKSSGAVRVILDLSSPKGASVNDFINKEDFPVKYSSFDDAVEMVAGIGPEAFLAKLDIKNAFTICPVKKGQWFLLAFKWQGKYYIYPILPFGLRSSPHIFNSLAELINWVINEYGCHSIHYLDYFLWHT